MNTYTSGPWRVDTNQSDFSVAPAYDRDVEIAVIRSDADAHVKAGDGIGKTEAFANARLLAAAPVLLETLNRVVAEYQIREVGRLKGDRIVIPFDVLEAARDAIAQATGEMANGLPEPTDPYTEERAIEQRDLFEERQREVTE